MLHTNHHRIPLFLPVLIGCGVALYFAQNAPTPVWWYGLVACVAIVGIFRGWNHVWVRLPLIALCAIMLGAVAAGVRLQMVDAPVLREPIFFKMVTGTLEDIQHKENKTKLILRDVTVATLVPQDTPKRLSISIKKTPNEMRIGSRIEIPAMLFPPPAPAMPGAYDFARMFYFEQLGAVGFSPKQPTILSVPSSRYDSPITSLRLSISDHLVAVMGKEAGAIASALIVGEQSRVSDEVNESMRASGIYHILSISGLHMALATGIIFFVVRLILAMIPHAAFYWNNKKIAAVFALIAGFAYLLLAGAPTPAVRSYIMVAAVFGAVLVDRKGISMFSLGWAATLILLIMPESLFTASFQLSFAATLAIVALYERFGGVLFYGNAGVFKRIFLYGFALMATSLAATFATSPLAVAHFNRMAVYGIFANMLMVPLSSFWIMPCAMLAMLLMPFGLDAWSLSGLKWGLDIMMIGSRFVSHFPYANILLPSPSDAGFIFIVMGGLWLALWASRRRLMGLVMMGIGLATIALFKPYDVIISDDAKRVAYRSASGQWVMIRGDVDSFEAELWLRAQAAEGMLSRKEALGKIPELRCDKTSCMIERGGTMMVVGIRKGAGDMCVSGADIVITDRFLSCNHIAHVIDRGFVSTHGATALRFMGNVIELATTEQHRGHWPWVDTIERAYDRNEQPETP